MALTERVAQDMWRVYFTGTDGANRNSGSVYIGLHTASPTATNEVKTPGTDGYARMVIEATNQTLTGNTMKINMAARENFGEPTGTWGITASHWAIWDHATEYTDSGNSNRSRLLAHGTMKTAQGADTTITINAGDVIYLPADAFSLTI